MSLEKGSLEKEFIDFLKSNLDVVVYTDVELGIYDQPDRTTVTVELRLGGEIISSSTATS